MWTVRENFIDNKNKPVGGESSLCYVEKLHTVMIRFSDLGAYLLLVVPQRRTLIREKALIRGRRLISFLRNNRIFKTKL